MAEYTLAHPSKAESEPFPIPPSDGVQYDLMGALETEEMRIRLWYFDPGESGSYHTHDVQEEVYFAVAGDVWARVGHGDDEAVVDLPEGAAIKVPTGVPREIGNDGDAEATLLAVSAPNQMEGAVWDAEQAEFLPLADWFQRG